MNKILFVDDQPELLRGTRRMLFCIEYDWQIDFVLSGEAALEKMEQESYDVIVSDMKMPGMDGAALLSEVAQRYPQVIRIVFSGYAEDDLVFKVIESAHQFLAKPINGELLIEALKRSLSLRNLLHDPRLAQVVAGIDSIPSLPSVHIELMEALESSNRSINEIGHIISKDVAMSAKIMQMVNSAFFSLRAEVKNPVHATNLLGIEVIKALVITVHVFKSFENNGSKKFVIDEFTNHSLSVGSLAKAVAVAENQPQAIVDDAFIAGMLHDVGKLILVSNFPELYDRSTKISEEQGLPYVYGEQEVYGTTHSEIGAYLLGLWGFRDNIVEAVAFHHQPAESFGSTFSPLTAVHIADAIENEYGKTGKQHIASIHMDYIADLNLIDRLENWRQVCLETQHSLMQYDS